MPISDETKRALEASYMTISGLDAECINRYSRLADLQERFGLGEQFSLYNTAAPEKKKAAKDTASD